MTENTDVAFAQLTSLRELSAHRDTVGMKDDVIRHFLPLNSTLATAIGEALVRRQELSEEFGHDIMSLPESELSPILQSDFINFLCSCNRQSIRCFGSTWTLDYNSAWSCFA